MLQVLECLAVKDPRAHENFWSEQQYVAIEEVKRPDSFLDLTETANSVLKSKRLAVPKMFIGGDDPKAKPAFVSQEVITLWQSARKTLESLGATVIETDFPLVSNYEDDTHSGHTNNVSGFKPDWNSKERGELVAYLWDDFLKSNGDPNYPNLASVDGAQMFPRPQEYIPDRYMEQKNFMNYPGLVEIARKRNGKSIWEIDGIAEALPALEAQRKRDLEDWMTRLGIDAVIFPAAGDVGRADLEYNDDSAKHALQNGIKYSNGNRAIRHMGVPTVSTTMGMMAEKKMPCNLTFAGRHGQDSELLQFAGAFEQASASRVKPPVTSELPSDTVEAADGKSGGKAGEHAPPKLFAMEPYVEDRVLHMSGTLNVPDDGAEVGMQVFVDGRPVSIQREGFAWSVATEVEPFVPETPLYGGYSVHVGKANVVVIARSKSGVTGEVFSVNP